MRRISPPALAALLMLAPMSWPAQAQTANATSPSLSSSGKGGNAAPIAPSGGATGTGAAGTVSPQGQRMANKPAVGGTTKQDIDEERNNDKKMTICKGC